MLWRIGTSLLHTAVVIKDREYAYGGHDRRSLSGVFWTKPRLEPPGSIFRCELLQGFTFRSPAEIDSIIKEVSQQFLGTSYNLLSNNCNHFTSHLCQRLTGRAAPSWLNRAATIGIVFPCIVPREWIAPPDHDTADGELLEELEEDEEDERAAMLAYEYQRGNDLCERTSRVYDHPGVIQGAGIEVTDRDGKDKQTVRDTDGRGLPASERAPQSSK